MKKAVIALLALCISLVAAVALVGCGESGPADKKADFIWFKVEVPEGVSVSNSAGDNANKAQLTFSNNDRIIPLWEKKMTAEELLARYEDRYSGSFKWETHDPVTYGDKTWLTGDYKHSGGTTSVFIIGVNEGSVSITVDNFEDHKAEVETVLNTIEFADNMSEAMKEAKGFGEVVEVASSAEATYTYIPKDYTVPADADYFHITTNNTIYGTELKEDLNVNVPMIADMSSDIFSRPIDVSKYICIYGGAQKNLAPAGVTFVIVKNDAVGKVSRYIPTMLNYQTHIDGGSMFNTPPVVPIYAALQTLRWIKAQGGVKEMERRAIEKADMLYAEIDRNKMFVGTAAKEDRSRMNICFVMAPEYKELEADFLKFATEKGMVGIKGHRSVGGFRASCYNAMPKESVQALIDCMQEFEKLH